MKIALLISGQPRRYRHGHHELRRWFLERYDIDVYLHSWKAKEFHKFNFFDQGKLEKVHKADDTLYENLINWYKPKDYLFESAIQFDGADLKGPNNQRLNSQMGMWMSLKRAWDLMENSGVKYDLIMKTRYDLLFTHRVTNTSPILKDLTKFDPNYLHYFGYPKNWNIDFQINDQIAIGGFEVMKKYCNLFPYMLRTIFVDPEYTNIYEDKFINETLILHHLKNQKVPLKTFEHGFNGRRGIDAGCGIMR